MTKKRPRVSVHKLSSCDGCQLMLLSLEDELLALSEAVDLVWFAEARSHMEPGPWDVALVEGSITTPEEAERIAKIRKESAVLVTIGACAITGGIQALRNSHPTGRWLRTVYPRPEWLDVLENVTPVSDHVKVDYELGGCPVEKKELLEVVTSLLAGRAPQIASHALCMDCKRAGVVCVTVAHGMPCLGPVTHAGCGALCPSYGRACYGCFGPAEICRPELLVDRFRRQGIPDAELARMFRGITGNSAPFRGMAEKLEESNA
ncbi:MAG TPA: oxidoreductase [Thermoanaerobaculia bacterium]|nr:oxidoreductase [Thermoanaerobaculia bacterium]